MSARCKFRATVLGAASFFAIPGVAYAQDTAVASQGATEDAQSGLNEIVVTAQKRSERLQDVPISVQAVGTGRLQQMNTTNLLGIASAVPGVHIGNFANQPFSAVFNIRGVGVLEADGFAGSSVAIVVDGVPQYFALGAVVDMADVERVEVLKGPQGTLFGANTTGGVVNIVNTRPSDIFEGYVSGTIGLLADKYVTGNVSTAINVPLTSSLSARFTALQTKRNGWIKNVENPDSNLGRSDKSLFRGQLKYESGNFEANLLGEYGSVKTGGAYVANGALPGEYWYVDPSVGAYYDPSVHQPVSNCTSLNSSCSAGNAVVAYDRTLPNESSLKNYRGVLTMDLHDTAIGDITSITGWKRYAWRDYLDTDGGIDVRGRGRDAGFGWQLSQELRSSFNIGDSFKGLVGAFFIKDHYETARQAYYASTTLVQTSQDQNNNSISAFANGYWDITPKLQIMGGIRFTHETTRGYANVINSQPGINFPNVGNLTYTDILPFCGSNCNGSSQTIPAQYLQTNFLEAGGKKSWDKVAWKVGVNFKPVDRVLSYASVSRGFKSGGFTLRIGRPEDIGPFAPEIVTTYEVGLKAEWLDRRLRTNVALFYNDYKDIQLATAYTYIDAAGTYQNGTTIQNAASAKIKGVEFDVTALIADGLTLGASGTYLDANYSKFVYQQTDGSGVTNVDLSGVRMQNAPKWSSNVYAEYKAAIASGAATFRVDYSYAGRKLQTIQPYARSFLKATNLVDASIGYAPDDGAWSVNLWAHNLLDKRYFGSTYSSPGTGAILQYSDPREFGVTVRANF